MKINISQPSALIKLKTQKLLSELVSPITGLDKQLGFIHRSSRDPKIISLGAVLTGVHTLFGTPDPGPGAYHIGGSGLCVEEAMIKTLAESVERYSHFMVNYSDKFECVYKSYRDMKASDQNVIDLTLLQLFSEKQFNQEHFPFQSYNQESLVGWVKLSDLNHGKNVWVPAQMLFVGYSLNHNHHEMRHFPSVTTGTAVHTDYDQALLNALMELIQIDATMGHWYSKSIAPKILLDNRARFMKNILQKCANFATYQAEFYYLSNIDLPGHVVACVFMNENAIPRVSIGLGADFSLNTSLYKAYLEACGVLQLSKLNLFNFETSEKKSSTFNDLDNNVRYYAAGNSSELIEQKFSNSKFVPASILPKYEFNHIKESIQFIQSHFSETNKDLFSYNLECKESKSLGLHSLRLWSPNLLSLAIPGAPPVKHPRFDDYGGFGSDALHPYP